MNKQAVNLLIKQEINYHPQGKDHFDFEGEGNYYQLSTYDKLTYTDHQGDAIEVKWQYDTSDQAIQQLEIRQPQGTLTFSSDQATHNPYNTPQGAWDLIIETANMQFVAEKQKYHLHLKYQMRLHQEKVGDYDFQLIFSPQEGNINS